MSDIENLRNQIDNIDAQLVDLLNRRADLAFQIKKLKLANNLPVLDQDREEKIHQMIKARSKGLLKESDLERIYATILQVMRGINEY